MYVSKYVCICMYVHLFTCVCVSTDVYITHIDTNARGSDSAEDCKSSVGTNMCVCTFIYIYIYIFLYMYI